MSTRPARYIYIPHTVSVTGASAADPMTFTLDTPRPALLTGLFFVGTNTGTSNISVFARIPSPSGTINPWVAAKSAYPFYLTDLNGFVFPRGDVRSANRALWITHTGCSALQGVLYVCLEI